jgi:phage gpG-like protein
MAKQPAVRVEGLRELRRDLRRIDPQIAKELQRELKDAAGKVAAEAALLAPRRTGALAESYRPFTSGNIAGVRSRLPYAAVHEYGGTISPRGTDILIKRSEPVTRAVERQTESIVEHVGDAIETAARNAGWR